ncbi:MAG: Gfo/Idh/MocA family oxidoreductase, partial [Inquilinus sp.]|nr:Gfo/Idh/MocA family oxidoreductase [Inquilinus sp.]
IQVGQGAWGIDWARMILPTVPGVEVIARVDGDPLARSVAADALGEPASLYFASLQAALDRVGGDAVLATVPLVAHAGVARAALAAGRHVIVEKPFAASLAEAADLVRRAEAAGRVLMVSQNYRHYAAPLAVATLLAEGAIGAIDRVEVTFRHRAEASGYRYYDLAQPLLSDMAIHHFDLMRMVLADEPLEIACRAEIAPGSRFAGPPAAEATIRFRRGAAVSYRGSWLGPDPPTAWAGEWDMAGGGGTLWWTSRGSGERAAPDRAILRRGDGVAVPVPLAPPPLVDRAGCLAAFADRVAGVAEPPHFPSGRDNLHSLAMVEAAIRSAGDGGRPVAVAALLAEVEDAAPVGLGRDGALG